VLGVRQAFLRSLNAVGAVRPQRTAGGRRRYSRRQLAFTARIRELFDQGHNWPRRCASWTWKTTWPPSAP
jgi:MerR family transcriptional regulator/heat shock protein HspR